MSDTILVFKFRDFDLSRLPFQKEVKSLALDQKREPEEEDHSCYYSSSLSETMAVFFLFLLLFISGT